MLQHVETFFSDLSQNARASAITFVLLLLYLPIQSVLGGFQLPNVFPIVIALAAWLLAANYEGGRSRQGERKKAGSLVKSSVEAFKEMLLSGTNYSIFWHGSPIAEGEHSLWGKRCAEKAECLRIRVEHLVEEMLDQDIVVSFIRLCDCFKELGNFITEFKGYFDSQGRFDANAKSWFNDIVLEKLDQHVKELQSCGNALASLPGQRPDGALQVIGAARKVEEQKPRRA